MGNIMGKPDYRGVMIDGGPAQIKDKTKRTRIEFGQTPAINAQTLSRLRAESNEYDPVLVGKLIATKKLAPFYEGKFDEKGDGRSVGGTRSDRASVMTSESRRRAASQSRQVQQKKPSKKGKSPSVVDQSWLNTSLLECPICLLVTKIFCYDVLTNFMNSGIRRILIIANAARSRYARFALSA